MSVALVSDHSFGRIGYPTDIRNCSEVTVPVSRLASELRTDFSEFTLKIVLDTSRQAEPFVRDGSLMFPHALEAGSSALGVDAEDEALR